MKRNQEFTKIKALIHHSLFYDGYNDEDYIGEDFHHDESEETCVIDLLFPAIDEILPFLLTKRNEMFLNFNFILLITLL